MTTETETQILASEKLERVERVKRVEGVKRVEPSDFRQTLKSHNVGRLVGVVVVTTT